MLVDRNAAAVILHGQRLADFTPDGVRYYNPNIKDILVESFKSSKLRKYFEGKLQVPE